MKLICSRCGKHYQSYQCGKYHNYCTIECRRKDGKKVASVFSKEFRKQKSKQFTEMNKTLMTEKQYIEKRRQTLLGKNNNKKGYVKYYGRHEHRIVAEKKIGRKLMKGEVVHHIDGDKRNNKPDNLMVLSSQSEHIKLHLDQGGGYL